jgi:hypothetical protein
MTENKIEWLSSTSQYDEWRCRDSTKKSQQTRTTMLEKALMRGIRININLPG